MKRGRWLLFYEDEREESCDQGDKKAYDQWRECRIEVIDDRYDDGNEHKQGVDEQRLADIRGYGLDIHADGLKFDLQIYKNFISCFG